MGWRSRIAAWFTKSAPRPPVPIGDGDTEELTTITLPDHPGWTYESQSYLGVHQGSHVFAVIYSRGDAERVIVHHRFLARGMVHTNDQERLTPFFRLHPPRS